MESEFDKALAGARCIIQNWIEAKENEVLQRRGLEAAIAAIDKNFDADINVNSGKEF